MKESPSTSALELSTQNRCLLISHLFQLRDTMPLHAPTITPALSRDITPLHNTTMADPLPPTSTTTTTSSRRLSRRVLITDSPPSTEPPIEIPTNTALGRAIKRITKISKVLAAITATIVRLAAAMTALKDGVVRFRKAAASLATIHVAETKADGQAVQFEKTWRKVTATEPGGGTETGAEAGTGAGAGAGELREMLRAARRKRQANL